MKNEKTGCTCPVTRMWDGTTGLKRGRKQKQRAGTSDAGAPAAAKRWQRQGCPPGKMVYRSTKHRTALHWRARTRGGAESKGRRKGGPGRGAPNSSAPPRPGCRASALGTGVAHHRDTLVPHLPRRRQRRALGHLPAAPQLPHRGKGVHRVVGVVGVQQLVGQLRGRGAWGGKCVCVCCGCKGAAPCYQGEEGGSDWHAQSIYGWEVRATTACQPSHLW